MKLFRTHYPLKRLSDFDLQDFEIFQLENKNTFYDFSKILELVFGKELLCLRGIDLQQTHQWVGYPRSTWADHDFPDVACRSLSFNPAAVSHVIVTREEEDLFDAVIGDVESDSGFGIMLIVLKIFMSDINELTLRTFLTFLILERFYFEIY